MLMEIKAVATRGSFVLNFLPMALPIGLPLRVPSTGNKPEHRNEKEWIVLEADVLP